MGFECQWSAEGAGFSPCHWHSKPIWSILADGRQKICSYHGAQMSFNREQHGCVKLENRSANKNGRPVFLLCILSIRCADNCKWWDFISLSGLLQKRDFICMLFLDTLEIPCHFHYFIFHFVKLCHVLAEGLQHFLWLGISLIEIFCNLV